MRDNHSSRCDSLRLDRPGRGWLIILLTVWFGAMLAGASRAADSGDAASAKRCFKCHAEDGLESGDGEPIIAAQPFAYIVAALDAFQTGARVDKSMNKVTKSMTREEMEASARYYASLPNKSPRQPFDPKFAGKGAGIHARLCEKCHVDGGRGFSMEKTPGPILAGQTEKYLRAQFAQFMSLDREMPSGMGIAMLELLPGDANALLHYYISRSP